MLFSVNNNVRITKVHHHRGEFGLWTKYLFIDAGSISLV